MITDTPNGRGKSQQANRAPAYGTYMDTSDGTKPSGLKKDTDSHSPQRRYISCCGTIYTLVLITPRAFSYIEYPIKDIFTCSGYHLSPCRIH